MDAATVVQAPVISTPSAIKKPPWTNHAVKATKVCELELGLIDEYEFVVQPRLIYLIQRA